MAKYVLKVSLLVLVVSFFTTTNVVQFDKGLYVSFGGVNVLAAVDRKDRAKDRQKNRQSENLANDRLKDRRRDNYKDRKRKDRFEDRYDDRLKDRRRDRLEHYVKFRIGVRLLTLPLRHTRVVIGPTVYFYSEGVYFIEQNGAYIVAASPVGARIARLPYGFRSFYIGPRRYFYVNSTYYVYAPSTINYVVIAAPENAPQHHETIDPVIYPTNNQSEEQIDQDRYECHRWALKESGFDPSTTQANSHNQAELYNRSIKACLIGRGYSVE